MVSDHFAYNETLGLRWYVGVSDSPTPADWDAYIASARNGAELRLFTQHRDEASK